MDGDQLETKLRNGWGARIAAGVLVILLSTSAIGTYSMAINFSALRERVEALIQMQSIRSEVVDERFLRYERRFERLDTRIRRIETHRSPEDNDNP